TIFIPLPTRRSSDLYLLKFVARSIRSAASKKDMAFRLGGDEFVMIMPSTDKAEAERVAQQIIASIENSTDPKIYMQGEKITVSIDRKSTRLNSSHVK